MIGCAASEVVFYLRGFHLTEGVRRRRERTQGSGRRNWGEAGTKFPGCQETLLPGRVRRCVGVLVGAPVPLLVARGDSRVVQVAAPPAGGHGHLALRVPLYPAELGGVPSLWLRRRAPPGARRRTRTARALGAEHGAREVERQW